MRWASWCAPACRSPDVAAFLQAVLGALLGALAEAFEDWRRDRALRALGYGDAALEQARVGIAAAGRMAAVLPADRADVVERLRNGRF